MRANGFTYGWTNTAGTNITIDARWRQSAASPDLRYDTFNHLQKSAGGAVWEFDLPNGYYSVRSVSGDITAIDSVFQFEIEDVVTPSKFPATGSNFVEFTHNVIVDDGRLTLRSALPLSRNNKINFLDILPATAAPLTLGAGPAPLTVEAGHPAVLNVAVASGSPPFRYQWLKDDVEIPGATGPALTISAAVLGDAGSYKVAVSNYAGAEVSASAALSVVADTTPPAVAGVVALNPMLITVCFSEQVNAELGPDTFNYRIDGQDGLVNGAVLQPDGRTVLLSMSSPLNETFLFEVTAMLDLAGNSIAPNSALGHVVPFTGVDIGAPAAAGAHLSCDGTNFTLRGGGTGLGGTIDQFRLVYRAVQGDFDARVRVASMDISNAYARAVLMARETTATNSRYAALSVTAPNPGRDLGEALARATTGAATINWGTNWNPGTFPVWLRLTRAGNALKGWRSADGVNWTLVSEATLAMPASLLVGMGTTGQDATIATANFSGFNVQWLTPAPTLINPVHSGGVFTASFLSQAGLSYDLQFKGAVTDISWTTIGSALGNGGTVPVSDPSPASASRLYRLRLR